MRNKTTVVLFCNKLMKDAYDCRFDCNSIPKYCRAEYTAILSTIRKKNMNYFELYTIISNSNINDSYSKFLLTI